MIQAVNVIRLIRPGDFPRIREIDYMAHQCRAASTDEANGFESY